MNKIEIENNPKQQNKVDKKQSEIDEITQKVTEAVEYQFEFLSSDETSKSEKIKEYTRLAVWLPTMIIPKFLILINFGIPAYIISKIFFVYLGIMPDNSETENKTIKNINSKTGINFLLKNRPIFHKEIRHIAQEKFIEKYDKFKNGTKKILRI